jgi:hypothetical protein
MTQVANGDLMNHEHDSLERRVEKLESRNRLMKYLGLTFFVLFVSVAARSPKQLDAVAQAQKFELRDAKGKLRAELSLLEGSPALRFFDADGEPQSIVADDSFTVFKKGGDIQAVFGANGLSFEDGHDKVFLTLGGREEDQAGNLRINDYRNKIFLTLTAEDLAKLHASFKK